VPRWSNARWPKLAPGSRRNLVSSGLAVDEITGPAADATDTDNALQEARRVVRPDGALFVVGISRWAARLHGVLTEQLYVERPEIVDLPPEIEATSVVVPRHEASFTGYSHRPQQLVNEIVGAGLDLIDLVNVEGSAALLPDLGDRLAEPQHASIILDSARVLEQGPELLGAGPHLLAVARRPPGDD